MSTDQENPLPDALPASRPPQSPPWFQFGLSTLFWITTATAVVCALVFQMPSGISLPVMVFISVAVLPAMWTTIIVFGRGYQRAFGIGAIFPAMVLLFFGIVLIGEARILSFEGPGWGQANNDFSTIRLVFLLCWTSDIAVGLVCMGVRWALERRRSSQ